jgi:transcriptional regulator with XRE-family HTH domain
VSVAIRRLEPEPPPENETLGQEFRRLRLALDLTQMEAAFLCGVTVTTISHWENEKRQFNSLDQSATIRKALLKLKRRIRFRKNGT